MFAGKALTVNMRGGKLFLDRHGNITVCVHMKAYMRELVNYFLIDIAQVYRLYMIWEFVPNAAMGMKRI